MVHFWFFEFWAYCYLWPLFTALWSGYVWFVCSWNGNRRMRTIARTSVRWSLWWFTFSTFTFTQLVLDYEQEALKSREKANSYEHLPLFGVLDQK